MKTCQLHSTARLRNQPTDASRIAAFRNGHVQALDEFYLLHRREFIKWAERTYGVDPAEAGDVYQDAMLILCENIRRGKLDQLGASLKTYFFSIGKNLILKKMVRCRNERKRWEIVQQEAELLESDHPEEYEEERLEAVKYALQGLSERNQSILRMYYYHELPLKDIAQQLGYESVDVVKNQKVRCLKYLKKMVEDRLVGKLAAA